MKVNYWEQRQQQLVSQLEKDESALKKKMSDYYDKESRKLEKEIAAYYTMYGTDNVIEYRTLMQNLSDEDKRRLIERMKDFAQLYPEYADVLPVRESIYNLNRLEGLQHSIRMQQYEMGAIDNQALKKHLEKQAMLAANTMAEELGFGANFYSMNPDIIKKLINQKWAEEKNFSERIWGNRQKLAEYLNNDFAAGIARGDSYQNLMRGLRKRFANVSRRDMQRLIYTEGTFAINEGMITPFEDDFEEYNLSIADANACPICKKIQRKKFNISERKAGINFPPLHAWCRCSFTIVIPDNFVEQYKVKHGGKQPSRVLQNSSKPSNMKKGNYKNFKEMQDYFKNKWGVTVDSGIENLDFSAVQPSADGIVNVLNNFPKAHNMFKRLGIGVNGVMGASFNGEITFNPQYYDDISNLTDMIQGATTGFHPKNTGLVETGSHEAGHILERALIEKNGFSGDKTGALLSWRECTEAKKVVSEACKAAKKTAEGKGKKNVELIEQVSRYAKKDKSETLAECVSDYMANGEKASILSKEVWKILKRELG